MGANAPLSKLLYRPLQKLMVFRKAPSILSVSEVSAGFLPLWADPGCDPTLSKILHRRKGHPWNPLLCRAVRL